VLAAAFTLLAVPSGAFAASTTAAAPADLLSMPIEQLMQVTVTSASRYEQRAADVAAAPQVIGAAEIRRFGYRTLVQILNHFGGTHTQSDGIYERIGVRGFLRPGDFNPRILLLLDGQRINEPSYDSTYLGNEALVDVALIERVEFIPGPGSSVYGSNALFGVVNVVTRRPADAPRAQLGLRIGTPAQADGIASIGFSGPGGGQGYAAVSGTFERGRLNDAATLGAASPEGLSASGRARDTNVRFFGRYDAGDIGLSFGHVRREVQPHNGAYLSDPVDAAQSNIDALTIASATKRWTASEALQIDTSLLLGHYRFKALLDYDNSAAGRALFRDDIDATWGAIDSRAVYRWSESNVLVTGIALQYSSNIRFTGTDEQTQSRYLDTNAGLRRIGAFAQNDWRISEQWNVSIGGRLDRDNDQSAVFSPRLGLVWQPAVATALKMQVGSAFRSPNAGEREYGSVDTGYKPNPDLRNEQLKAAELTLEHAFSERFTLRATVYRYRVSGLIEQTTDETDGLLWWVNEQAVSVRGAQLDMHYAAAGGWSMRGSVVRQQGSNEQGQALRYSPHWVSKATAMWPVAPHWWLALRGDYTGRQQARDTQLGGYTLLHAALTAEFGRSAFTLSANNIADKHFSYPVSEAFSQPQVPGPGRSLLLSWSQDF
jgi:outer membrane receptor protein involved in Fe transport